MGEPFVSPVPWLPFGMIAFGTIALMVASILTRGIPLPVAVIGHEGSSVLGLRLLVFRE